MKRISRNESYLDFTNKKNYYKFDRVNLKNYFLHLPNHFLNPSILKTILEEFQQLYRFD